MLILIFSHLITIYEETPPTLIFHGDSDNTVNPETVILYNSKMKMFNNFCRLFLYEGEEHGFFNFGRNDNGAFVDTLNKMDAFLIELGYISLLKINH